MANVTCLMYIWNLYPGTPMNCSSIIGAMGSLQLLWSTSAPSPLASTGSLVCLVPSCPFALLFFSYANFARLCRRSSGPDSPPDSPASVVPVIRLNSKQEMKCDSHDCEVGRGEWEVAVPLAEQKGPGRREALARAGGRERWRLIQPEISRSPGHHEPAWN